MIADDRLAALRERAERHGYLRIDDIREILPVGQMSADDLAMLILQLEEAGVTVEVDDELIGSSRRRAATAPETPVVDLPGAQPPSRDAAQPAPAPGLAPDAYASPEPVGTLAPADRSGWKFVAAAGAVIAAGAAIVLYLAR